MTSYSLSAQIAALVFILGWTDPCGAADQTTAAPVPQDDAFWQQLAFSSEILAARCPPPGVKIFHSLHLGILKELRCSVAENSKPFCGDNFMPLLSCSPETGAYDSFYIAPACKLSINCPGDRPRSCSEFTSCPVSANLHSSEVPPGYSALEVSFERCSVPRQLCHSQIKRHAIFRFFRWHHRMFCYNSIFSFSLLCFSSVKNWLSIIAMSTYHCNNDGPFRCFTEWMYMCFCDFSLVCACYCFELRLYLLLNLQWAFHRGENF